MTECIHKRSNNAVKTTTKLRENEADTSDMVNADFEPTDEEDAILRVFREQRQTVNPMYLREQTGLDKGSINTALTRLTSAGWVRKVTRGLYEFVDDPRKTDTAVYGHESSSGADISTPTPTSEVDRDALRDELPGSGDHLKARVDAITDMYEYLREHGEATKDELLEAVEVDATGYASEASVWSNMVKGRDTLRALPGVEPPRTGMSTWRHEE